MNRLNRFFSTSSASRDCSKCNHCCRRRRCCCRCCCCCCCCCSCGCCYCCSCCCCRSVLFLQICRDIRFLVSMVLSEGLGNLVCVCVFLCSACLHACVHACMGTCVCVCVSACRSVRLCVFLCRRSRSKLLHQNQSPNLSTSRCTLMMRGWQVILRSTKISDATSFQTKPAL